MSHDNPLDPGHLIGHVKDAPHFEVPGAFAEGGKLEIPQPLGDGTPIVPTPQTGMAQIDQQFEAFDLTITKFMILEVVAAVIIAVIFIRLGQLMKNGGAPKGRFWNLFEVMVVYIRDEVARPCIGEHDFRKFTPFLWTIFFFVLICNLLGMLPWLGSPTGALATTGALAFVTFAVVVGSGSAKLGPIKFWTAQAPHIDLHPAIALPLQGMVFAIEVLGLFIKHFVLAMRLLANMAAGHLVLAVMLAFIAAAWTSPAIIAVVPASIFGCVAISLLELFVAFLQAYIFTFLAALFIGAGLHPH